MRRTDMKRPDMKRRAYAPVSVSAPASMPAHPLLVEDARDCLGFEREARFSARAARLATRDMLADRARELGIAERDVERAVDAALRAAAQPAARAAR
jgi:hypothetical protein